MQIRNKIILSIVYIILGYAFFYLAIKKINFINFSYDLLLLFTIFNIFLLLHLYIKPSKIYSFIYKKRYFLGALTLIILIICKYNGSSIMLWNNYIQPEYRVKNSIILGTPRGIRSDEWLVSTPLNLTQESRYIDNATYNDILGAHKNLVTLYPNLPSRDISILSTPNNIGYLFLDAERAYSLSWYLPYFVLFFATFEMFMILTKGHKLYSLTGSILITLSPVVQWWQSANIIAYGSLAIVLFYYLINADNWKKKLLLSIIFGYAGYLYIMCMYPAWQVPYAYVYLILLIWIIHDSKDKIHIKDLLYLIPIFIVIAVPILLIFKQNTEVLKIINSTVYPGSRMSTGGGEWRTLFTYVLDIFYPYKRHLTNPCEFSQYLSLFPVPIIYSIYLMIKNKKEDLFLILSDIVLICLTIWIVFPLPAIISKLTLIYMSTEVRAQVAIGYLSVIEIIYILNHYESKKKSRLLVKENIPKIVLSFIIICLTIKVSNNVIEYNFPGFVGILTNIVSILVFVPIMFLFVNNNKKTNLVLSLIFIGISFIAGILVSPINKGLSIFYDKPLAKEVNKLVSMNNNAVFMSVDDSIITANYLAVNGAKTINTTNYVPYLELYYKLDPESKYDDVYNRYENVNIELIDEPTKFSLITDDHIKIELSKKDICRIGVDYIVYNGNDSTYLNQYEKIYDEYNTSIYKTNCKMN